uniref:EF-hand domain-containing protein 1 n=1 Tax=Panagrellus redivivus TaxID=6233 RepID=A0A7E4VHE4_PANRE
MPSSFDEPKLSQNCECFDTDDNFFTHSFHTHRGRRQIFDKKDNVSFLREDPLSRPKRSWEPLRNVPFADYFDPVHKAALTYTCYLNETDGQDNGELLKIRPMKLVYHLDDETMTLTEPFSDNSGHLQGRMFASQKVPRADKCVGNEYLTWKDIHIGEDLKMFGRTYRVVSCDPFTKAFLEDRGIKVRETETIPIDSWNLTRHFTTDRAREAALKQFIKERDKTADMVSWEQMPHCLNFLCAWLDTKNDFYGERVKRTFKFAINAIDDSVTMTELTPGFGNQIFLRTDQLPYVTPDGIRRYYRAANMRPGMWIDVYHRPMYIYDVESEPTKKFIKQQYGEISFGDCPIKLLEDGPPSDQVEVLPEELWFRATNPEYPAFKFLIIFCINSRRVDIYEEGKIRPWTKGRPFLLEIDAGPLREKDFQVGARVVLFKWTFTLTEASIDTKAYLKAKEVTTER